MVKNNLSYNKYIKEDFFLINKDMYIIYVYIYSLSPMYIVDPLLAYFTNSLCHFICNIANSFHVLHV